jgi:hypothetical protein
MAKEGSRFAEWVWKAGRSSLNSGAPLPEPRVAEQWVLGIQRKLHKWASDDQDRRFQDLHNLVCDPATLVVAWQRVRANRGSRSAGVDGQTAAYVEQVLGVELFLAGLREELRSGSYRPDAVKQRAIPKRGGKLRYLGIATVRDRVVQAALKLVLEPIFEVDFEPCSYGFRPGRRAWDAIAEVRYFSSRSYEWIVEADIQACFDELSHAAISTPSPGVAGDTEGPKPAPRAAHPAPHRGPLRVAVPPSSLLSVVRPMPSNDGQTFDDRAYNRNPGGILVGTPSPRQAQPQGLTGRRSGLVRGCESVLRRSGDSVSRKMTEAREPKDKLEAATIVVVNGPEDASFDWLRASGLLPSQPLRWRC